MEITKQPVEGALEVRIKGRLDAYWADHLDQFLTSAIREGADRIHLHCEGIDYISSAGIRILIKFYKQLLGIQGVFRVVAPSEATRAVMELSGIDTLLGSTAAPSAPVEEQRSRVDRGHYQMEVFELAPSETLRTRVVGNPMLLPQCGFREADCARVRFSDSTFAVGVGAFGDHFADCRNRFGEFLAVGGAAAALPTDGTGVADFIVTEKAMIPELQVLYGVVGEGRFARLSRFEAKPESRPVSLTELVEEALQISKSDHVGVVLMAESAGLVGAALMKSPVRDNAAETPFHFPEIRDWFSFTAERAHARALALVVGIASRRPGTTLAPFLKPMGRNSPLFGHFHAAAFPYRPLKKGRIDLRPTVESLFEAGNPNGILHLLRDDREIESAGQSEFFRGACWMGALQES